MGIDPSLDQLPDLYRKTPEGISRFCIDIIDASKDFAIAYKVNMAFFEVLGSEFWSTYTTVRSHIPSHIPVILDAKRGDIGNSSNYLAKYLFDTCDADAVTVHPYMGFDSIEPFLNYKDKFTFILGHTSNSGAKDFQSLTLESGKTLAAHMINRSDEWLSKYKNIGVVVGATQKDIQTYRLNHPQLLFLMPGVGKQGASYSYAYTTGQNSDQIALINASRGILSNTKGSSSIAKFKETCINNIKALINE